ncbi:MAG TPA: glutathione S-transferase family protein [Candidatus Saccharimonadales bacterium]|nr:glutathione S-transferase family protein [Candidatus Saccharimonadales bacterium]
MKLYYSPLSSNSRKVRIVAAHLGIELELQNVELPKGEQRRPEYLAINPMGKVPVLADGDFVLPESAAIMIYLAETKPGNTLYPDDRQARAEVNRWLFWAANHWAPAVVALVFEKVLKQRYFNGGAPDPVQIKRQEEQIARFATVLDAQLAKHPWVAGDTLTLADISIAPAFAAFVALPVQSCAHIPGWFKRIQALPAWQATEPPKMA